MQVYALELTICNKEKIIKKEVLGVYTNTHLPTTDLIKEKEKLINIINDSTDEITEVTFDDPGLYSAKTKEGSIILLTIRLLPMYGEIYTVTELNDLECEYPTASCTDICLSETEAIKRKNELMEIARKDLDDIEDEGSDYLYDGRNTIFYDISKVEL